VTAVSRYLRDETYKAFLCQDCPIEVIPNFINPTEYYPSEDARCRSSLAPFGTKVLMHVSNFRKVKRVPEVVRTFARVREEVPAVLVLVGDGPERPDTEAEVARLGLTEHVRFLGKVNAVADLLRAADLFLLPSQSESFGLAALEAMACGVPVIASNVGGLPEVVPDGEAGALVPVGDVDAMAANALEYLEPTRWERAREAAVDAARRYDEAEIVPMYEDLYARVLDW
jgi:N-acetyl-alpha-D-glucosaminyl L-malate synthase BshA